MSEQDNINHPKHYNTSPIEVIDAIEAWELDFHLGSAIKYIARAGKKDPNKTIEDLKKSVWYINRKIDQLEKEVFPSKGAGKLERGIKP